MRNASPEERTMARDAVQRVRDAIPAHREKWHAGIAAGRDAVGSDRPCAIQPTVRASMSTNGGSFGSMADALEALRYADGRTAYPFALESGEVTPPRIALAESEFISDILPSIQGRVDGDRLDSFLERARSLDSFWSFDVLVVPERYHPPLASADGQSFTPGEFEGRALVYSYVEDRVVCSAAFRAQSAARSVHFSAQLAMESIELMRILLADFNVEIERHAALALRQRGAIEDNAIEEDLPE